MSESSLKRWIDDGLIEVTRTSGGHRRVALAEAVRFVRQRGYKVNDPSVLGLSASDDETGRADDAQRTDHFHEMLEAGQDKEFVSAVTGLYLNGHTIAELVDGPIKESMRRIGELWHGNPDGIAIEHRATDILIRTLGHMHTLIKTPPADAPLALGGAPPQEMHQIGSLCISLILAEQGWREANLGARMPWEQLYRAAEREKAALVWVSITNTPSETQAPDLVKLADSLATLPCQLVVGGRELSDDILRLDAPNLHIARSMAELVSFSRGLLVSRRSPQGAFGDEAEASRVAASDA